MAARRARWGIALSGVLQAFGMGLLVVGLSQGLAVSRMAIEGTTDSVPNRDVILLMASGLLSSAPAVPAYVVLALLLIWVHQVVANGVALGHRGPGDAIVAVISFFVLVVGWWWPYQLLRDAVPESATAARRALLRWCHGSGRSSSRSLWAGERSTWYEAEGSTLIQVVDATNAVAPIVFV